jgi:hypothetical protein
MVTALLIVFEYQTRTLPGAFIDLCIVTRYAEYICGNNDKIHIITDISKISFPQHLNEALARSYITEDQKLLLIKYQKNIHLVESSKDLRSALGKFHCHDALFVYYSGHSSLGDIILPNNERISCNTVHSSIARSGSMIFWVMDCCYAQHLDCKYQWRDSQFYLLSSEPVLKRMILIAAAEDQEAKTTVLGSHFTRILFRLLSTGKFITISNICKISDIVLLEEQKISVYSTHKELPVLWTWTGAKPGIHITLLQNIPCYCNV